MTSIPTGTPRTPRSTWSVALLALGAVGLALAALYQVSFYLRIPVDLLSFAESPYITDIIKLREGLPLYTPVADNNSYPYTPGSQLLTYAIGSAFGHGTDIAFLRHVQFCYVLLASLIAGLVADGMAQLLIPQERRGSRGLWLACCASLLFLVALDPRFNNFVHSLHNDGLAMLISMSAAWLAVSHARGARRWHLVAMALLPALAFLVKQNQLMWAGLFAIYLWFEGTTPKRWVLAYGVAAGVLGVAVMGGSVLVLGENFRYWIFGALGDKQVSLARSVLHLIWAGLYLTFGLLALVRFVLPGRSRAATALWLMTGTMFALTTYTSGLGWTANHMGPAMMLATAWFLVVARDAWPDGAGSGWEALVAPAAAAGVVLAVMGGLGVVRLPRNEVSPDLPRYIAAVNREFEGMDPATVLLDNGSWPYLAKGIVMKDRSSPVTLHATNNQSFINRPALAETIQRIKERRYRRILARLIDTDQSPYDFHDRGSGVKSAILENYQIVRRIPGVEGVQVWWPLNLLAEVVVLEPRSAAVPSPTAPPSPGQ
ncbi:MAG: hypothetical protein U0164_05725 [Gemmatimonadaceae bacterium]